jgi:hypothetical protein
LDRLQELCDREEIQLGGDELRLLLMLAGQAKRRMLKPRLRVVAGTA